MDTLVAKTRVIGRVDRSAIQNVAIIVRKNVGLLLAIEIVQEDQLRRR